MNHPTFSIIIPVYNVENYLTRCIDSVISQTFKDFEIILVDDGSTDSTPQLCDSFSIFENIKVYHKENGGSSSARNLGIKKSTGDWILFIDSDDYWESKNALLDLYQRSLSFPQNDIILFGCHDIFLGSKIEKLCHNKYDLDLINKDDKSLTIKSLCTTHHYPGAAWIMCVKRDLIEKLQLKFPIGVTAEDLIWINELIANCNSIGAINSTFYAYNIGRPGQVTAKASIKGIQGMSLAISSWLNHKYKSKYPDIIRQMAHIYTVMLMDLGRLDKENRKKAIPIINENKSILRQGGILHKIIYALLHICGPYITGLLIYQFYLIRLKYK